MAETDNKTKDPQGIAIPNAYEQLIGNTDLAAYEGVGLLMAQIEETPRLRNAMLLRTTTRLRERLQSLGYESPCNAKVELDAQDAVLLLDLLLRRLG